MPLTFNGITPNAIKFGTADLTKVIYNGVTVWEKVTSKTYRYKAKAVRIGSNSLSTPTSTGTFQINTNQSCMWCFLDENDVTGYSTSLSICMGKTITSMKFYFYRTNTYGYSSSNNCAWTYNVQINNSGMAAIHNRNNGYNVNRAPSTPSAAGSMDSGLTTAELKNIFASSCRKQYTDTSGSGCNQLTAVNYYSFGLRCLYPPSGAVQFRCNNVNNTNLYDAYIEIVAM